MKWETLKEEIVTHSKKYAEMRVRNKCRAFKELQTRLNKIMSEFNKQDESHAQALLEEELVEVQSLMRNHIEYVAQGARMRSKQKWSQMGGKVTKYILGLEKIRYNNKTMRQLLCEDNTVTRNQRKIFYEQTKYYRKLYTSNPDVICLLETNYGACLSDDDKTNLDRPFQSADFMKAAKQMKSSKTPGIDGLTAEFYKVFRFTLKPPISIGYGKFRLAIWDTSFWNFLVKFGHNGL